MIVTSCQPHRVTTGRRGKRAQHGKSISITEVKIQPDKQSRCNSASHRLNVNKNIKKVQSSRQLLCPRTPANDWGVGGGGKAEITHAFFFFFLVHFYPCVHPHHQCLPCPFPPVLNTITVVWFAPRVPPLNCHLLLVSCLSFFFFFLLLVLFNNQCSASFFFLFFSLTLFLSLMCVS